MNWNKSLCVAILTGAVLTAAIGCGQAESTETVETQTPLATPTADSSVTQIPRTVTAEIWIEIEPFSGNVSGRMQMPPSVNFTREKPSAPMIDMASAAAQLGITEAELSEALGENRRGIMDLAAIAEKFGLSEDALREALGFSGNLTLPFSGNRTIPGGTPPDGSVPNAL